jgi:hypothetical protein
MFAILAVLIVTTVAIAAFLLLPKMRSRRLVFETAPDVPCPFGPGMAWLAIKSNDPLAVAGALGLDEVMASNWSSGIGTVYDIEHGANRVFISPPVNGFVFAVASGLPLPQGAGFVDKHGPLIEALAARFPDVQMFAAFPEIDLFAWSRTTGGRTVRSFAVADQGVVVDRGKTTREEKALGLKLYELRGVRGRRGDAGGELLMHPTEEHVMRLAGHWSLNPTLLAGHTASPAHGYIGFAPMTWRSERMRKRA